MTVWRSVVHIQAWILTSDSQVVLQINRGKRDDLGIVFHYVYVKLYDVTPSLEWSQEDGSNKGSQHIFIKIKKKKQYVSPHNYLRIISKLNLN